MYEYNDCNDCNERNERNEHNECNEHNERASFPEDLIIVKILKIDVFISAERGKQGGFDGIIFY